MDEKRSVRNLTRDYFDSLMIETRVIDSGEASTEMKLFGETFSTPVMVAPLSGLGGICPNPMQEVAKGAAAAGAEAIVVSNHGGSIVDSAVPPLKVLPRIVKVIEGKIPIFVDGGITKGTDVFKALALGANGVLAGRMVMSGLASEGGEGVRKVITDTNEDLRRTMRLTGSPDIHKIDPEIVWY
ncbi:MAG: (S)-mandelate dehydrogenase [Candidatus Dichloromethanomonas elyunquensis]|nr:MAG: (S)-mandelate dehydrogenase [Candidatus Dichloromethanomonas elyunquensis]